MSFERQTSSFSGEPSPVSVYENHVEEHESLDDLDEEVDLESPEGRSLLIQEIENLALTCDAADDPDSFAKSAVFGLVEELQTVLAEIEQTQLLGDAITDTEAETVQELYDQLAIEVEQPAVISVYVGPSRKDMVLEDLSDDGSITITQLQKAKPEPGSEYAEADSTPEPTTSFIHNSLPERPVAPTQPAESKSESAKSETLYTPDASEVALQKKIDVIETAEVSFLDAWMYDYQSPYKVLGDLPFAELQQMASAPVNSRTYIEFKSLLEQEKIKYEVFNQWAQQFTDMDQVVDRAQQKTFKQVIDEYLTITTAT